MFLTTPFWKTSLITATSPVWHELGKGNDNMVERLQRRAARIIYSSTVAVEIITKLGWEPFKELREAHLLSLVKKCIRNDVP